MTHHSMSWSLTLKRRETQECVLSPVASEALVLTHQAISIDSADLLIIVLDQFHTKVLHLLWTSTASMG